jgi:DNA-binding NarL/FixJ family response regulator
LAITVCIADDHAVVREGLRLILDSQDEISVIGEAADGRTAVRLVEELAPQVVVMDIAMPELNGIEATRTIAERCPSTHVVILSVYSGSEYVVRAFRAGARGYLLKESAGSEVAVAVRAVTTGRRYVSQCIAEKLIDAHLEFGRTEPAADPLQRLSAREREILQLVVEGKSSAEIGQALYLSPKSVETYRSRLMRKLGIDDLPGLVKFAIRHGLTGLE